MVVWKNGTFSEKSNEISRISLLVINTLTNETVFLML